MKKKIIVSIIILSMTISGITILFRSTIKENITKRIINRVEKESENELITTVNITGITPMPESQHEHIYKTLYDDTKHWEQCTVCSTKRNEMTHEFTTTWLTGEESCHYSNEYTSICKCGYSKKGCIPCLWEGEYTTNGATGHHVKVCANCRDLILAKKYYSNGRLYDNSGKIDQKCYNENRKAISCTNSNIGTCRTCGHYYGSSVGHRLRVKEDGKTIYCMVCSRTFGTYSQEVSINKSSIPFKYTMTSIINIPTGIDVATHWGYTQDVNNESGKYDESIGILNFDETEQYIESVNEEYTEMKIVTKGRLANECKKTNWVFMEIDLYVNDRYCEFRALGAPITVTAEEQAPTISNIQVESGEWTRSKPITISGTENYCDSVSVEIKDDKDITIYSGKTNVNRKNWTISCVPELETGEMGKTFKVIATDNCGNATEQEFTISKIDGIAPTPTSNDQITGEWAKERDFTFTATDQGIGNVQIAFNNISDYQPATKEGENYSRIYKFIGDAYSQVQASIYYKDGLGNITTQVVTIDKIDNTAPTIIEASISNNKLNIVANDMHETLGEGSGVTKYRYITSTTKLENPEITQENSIEKLVNEEIIIPEIYKVKYVYIIAEDLVGNASSIYEVQVPQLKLTSKVNLSDNNGKGAIELDWSSYDIQNKYFVIYRIQEGEEQWKTIVRLDEKFNNNKYIDNLGNDKNSPAKPNINIQDSTENNSIEITTSAIDTGTKYKYYIESYDIATNTLINSSNS